MFTLLLELEFCNDQYRDRANIPGHSAIPRILFWARMAAVGGDTEAAARMVEHIKSRVRTY